MMDTAGSRVAVGSRTGNGGGVGRGMFDAGTGLSIGTLVGADVGVGVATADTGVGLPVGGGSSLQADSSAMNDSNRSPDRRTRRVGPNVVDLLSRLWTPMTGAVGHPSITAAASQPTGYSQHGQVKRNRWISPVFCHPSPHLSIRPEEVDSRLRGSDGLGGGFPYRGKRDGILTCPVRGP